MVIDSHHHFWRYDPGTYDWITDDMSILRRNFFPGDLKHELNKSGVDGVISVQARQSLEETTWLLDLAEKNDFIKGITGWVPLIDAGIEKIIENYSSSSYLKAVRHVLQGEQDEYFMRKDFNRGISCLRIYNLVYEILIYERQLSNIIEFVDLHPGQTFVLDHLAKPEIKKGKFYSWEENIFKLSLRQNVSCKISGMVTEADYTTWKEDQLQPYLNTVLEAFGPDRLMFGSDWPVCLVAVSYDSWISIVRKFISKLSPSEQEKIMGGNAAKIYRISKQ